MDLISPDSNIWKYLVFVRFSKMQIEQRRVSLQMQQNATHTIYSIRFSEQKCFTLLSMYYSALLREQLLSEWYCEVNGSYSIITISSQGWLCAYCMCASERRGCKNNRHLRPEAIIWSVCAMGVWGFFFWDSGLFKPGVWGLLRPIFKSRDNALVGVQRGEAPLKLLYFKGFRRLKYVILIHMNCW